MVGRLRISLANMSLRLVALFLLLLAVVCLPVVDPKANERKRPQMPDIPGLDREEYKRYWEEIADSVPSVKERLNKLNPENAANIGALLGDRMARKTDEVRGRLDEARRVNVEDMRHIQRMQMLKENMPMEADWLARKEALRGGMPDSLSHDDLQKKLEEQRQLMAELDEKRRDDFKRYEMQMEHQRRAKLKEMDEKHRLGAEEQFKELHEKLKQHERLNQPASKQQFKEVWEEEDGMKGENFDPKTFFNMHDTNGDHFLDPLELESLFYHEVQKVYKDKMEGIEPHEEMARMREFVTKEVDRNGDGRVSREEFLTYTRKDDFEKNEEWKPAVDEPEDIFTEKEFDQFNQHYDDYQYYDYDEEIDRDGNVVKTKTQSQERRHETGRQHEQQPHEGQQQEHKDVPVQEIHGDPSLPNPSHVQQLNKEPHKEQQPSDGANDPPHPEGGQQGAGQQGAGQENGLPLKHDAVPNIEAAKPHQ